MKHTFRAIIAVLLPALLIQLAANPPPARAGQEATQAAAAFSPRVEITFVYQRQSGKASNQFAVWIEDAAGQYVKTLYVTRFTAKGGWKRRPQSLPRWVKTSQLAAITSQEVDAFSGATPLSGQLAYAWDCRDAGGMPVPPGTYRYLVEANLRWTGTVLYRGTIAVGGPAQRSVATRTFSGEAMPEREMITAVAAAYCP
jgi:hypothetical protein